MSKKAEPVEEPQVDDDDAEESDEYDVEEEEEEAEGFEQDDEGEGEDDAGLTQKGDSLTALLLGGDAPAQDGEDEEEDEEDEDEEYTPAPEITGPATEAIAASPPEPISRKRSRDDEDANGEADDLSGDYGEFEENGEAVKKKARAAEAEAEEV
ncbi:hypothetical protein PsYK624_057410 [Phanerochaete sordida]|uniref:Uncharacterized protein n=1 Tax=Phanerochaete sordida TaxID=48140 RepID=A0A9P3LD79_9APHY|nr:hypothetical protein PsYK624_057410 [Phanerochaete sordida]